MKVRVARFLGEGAANRAFGGGGVPRRRGQQGLEAQQEPAGIAWMSAEELRDAFRRLLPPAELKQRERRLERPQRGVEALRIADGGQRVLVPTLVQQVDAQPKPGGGVERIERHGGPQLVAGAIEQAHVVVQISELEMGFGEIRVQLECVPRLAHGAVIRPVIRRGPQKTTADDVRRGEVGIQAKGALHRREGLLLPHLVVRLDGKRADPVRVSEGGVGDRKAGVERHGLLEEPDGGFVVLRLRQTEVRFCTQEIFEGLSIRRGGQDGLAPIDAARRRGHPRSSAEHDGQNDDGQEQHARDAEPERAGNAPPPGRRRRRRLHRGRA